MRTRAPLLAALVLLGRAAGAYASSAHRRTASRDWWSTVAGRGAVCPYAWMPGRRLLACLSLLCVLVWLSYAGSAQATLVYVRPVGTGTAPQPPHRGEIFAAANDGARPRALARGFAPVISPNGRQIAFLRYQGDRTDLWTMGVGGRHQSRVLRSLTLGAAGGLAYRPYAWSSDSRRLAVTRGPSVSIVTVRDRRRVDVNVDAENPSFAPDGRHLVADFGTHGSTVELIDPRKPNRFVGLGSGYGQLGGKPGIAFLRGSTIMFVGHPRARAQERVLVDDRRSGEQLTVASWSLTATRLLAGIARPGRAYNTFSIEPLLVDPVRGTQQHLPNALSGLNALSRDGRTVLGQAESDVVLERTDGTIKILAPNADSATWTA